MLQGNFSVSDTVLQHYVLVNESNIKNLIADSILRSSIKKNGNSYVCFLFNSDNCFVFEILDNNLITRFSSYSYEELIPIEFLKQFYVTKEYLSVRLKRWAHQEYYHLLREEIIEAMINKKVTFTDVENGLFIFIWEKLGIKFVMSEKYTFTKLVVHKT